MTPTADFLPTEPLSVSAALELARAVLMELSLSIIGEVSEISDKPGYKAVYFTLSDESSALPCVIWRNNFERLDMELKQGQLVEVSGRFSLYTAKGRMNFEVRSLRPLGEGELRVRVAALARQLAAEGLMAAERKRPLPLYPLRIGLVTSPRGKAVHDVLRTLRRRWPLAEVLLAGVAVEGETAPAQMIEALSVVQAAQPEVILLVRGGGSYEDLMPFNDEALARAVAACAVPVVSGIGHEPDTSIVDLVADFRASTPTAAAEAVSPDRDELQSWLAGSRQRLAAGLQQLLWRQQERVRNLAAQPLFRNAEYLLRPYQLQLEQHEQRLSQQGENILLRYSGNLQQLAGQLEALSPLAILARGYTLASDQQGRLIRRAAATHPDQRLRLQFQDGRLECLVERVELAALAPTSNASTPGKDHDEYN
ncbi:MAG: exodeoxyribonuclease VII large subunit [Actinomycetia bacterium]|nr:exodeoxyribonuclease VII large subunit [Actinomycetes bacterium]